MGALLFIIPLVLLFTADSPAAEGFVTVKRALDDATTADRLESALATIRMTIFARIDHAAGALANFFRVAAS